MLSLENTSMYDLNQYLKMLSGYFSDKEIVYVNNEAIDDVILKYKNSNRLIDQGLVNIRKEKEGFAIDLVNTIAALNNNIYKLIIPYLDKVDSPIYSDEKNNWNHAICTYDLSMIPLRSWPYEDNPVLATTKLDWALYYFIGCFYDPMYLSQTYEEENIATLAALIYIFRNTLDNEARYHYSLDVCNIEDASTIIDVLTGDWNDYHVIPKIKLDEKMAALVELRVRLRDLYANGRKPFEDKCISHIQNNDNQQHWRAFISLYNYKRSLEEDTINIIKSDCSRRKKRDAINHYFSNANHLEPFLFEEEYYSQADLMKVVVNRCMLAPQYCYVTESGSDKYIPLEVYTSHFAFFTATFNHLIISFHDFRLSLDSESLYYLMDVLTRYFSNSFGELLNLTYDTNEEDDSDFSSKGFVEQVYYCYDIIKMFNKDHSKTVGLLKRTDVIPDMCFTDEGSINKYIEQLVLIYYRKINLNILTKGFNTKKERDELIDYSGPLGSLQYSSNKGLYLRRSKQSRLSFKRFIDFANNRLNPDKIYERAKSAVLLGSANAIYLFAKTLSILNETKELLDIKSQLPDIDSIISGLTSIERSIVRRGYTSDNIFEYRIDKGIDYSKIELLESKRDYSQLLMHIQNSIESASDYESLLQLRTELSIVMESIPDDEKKYYFSDYSEKIEVYHKYIIETCQKDDPADYSLIKERIKDSFGDNFDSIAPTVIQPLCSAELLYERFVCDESLTDQFDYSGISSLYYQSLEELFNTLIWEKYIDYLNSLTVQTASASFKEMYTNNEWLPKEYMGYLPASNRKYYINSSNELVSRFMPGSTYYLLNDAYIEKRLPKLTLCIGNIFNINKSSQKDKWDNYILLMTRITKLLETGNKRNEASHGGTIVTREQCIQDKSIVFSANNGEGLGIINLLVSLI